MSYLRRIALTSVLSFVLASGVRAQDVPGPSFREVLELKEPGEVAIAPDGSAVAFTLRETDWDANRFDSEIWLVREDGQPFQLTRTPDGGSSSPRWSPDGRWIAFLADRGEQRQIHLIRPDGGEAWPLTSVEEEVGDFRWAPASRRIAFTAIEPKSEEDTKREGLYGEFDADDEGYRMTHLWIVDVPDTPGDPSEPRRLTGGAEFTVAGFEWSPDGSAIAFEHRPDPLINSWMQTDISILDVPSGSIRSLLAGEGPDLDPVWSPDGRWILFSEYADDLGSLYYLNNRLARIPAAGGPVEILTPAFDERPCCARWKDEGIYFAASQRTRRTLFRIEPAGGTIREVGTVPHTLRDFDVTADGRRVALIGEGPESLPEIYVTEPDRYLPRRLTRFSDQTAGWPVGTREVVEWRSRDATPIEGVLYKPADYRADRRYPLLVVIHGGPTATSRPEVAPSYVYPILQWLARGAVVLAPNYRGSAGYGEAFRSLNVRNLGVGDMWDILSGVDHLVETGVAHPDSLGAMGWSQGGYISAFLTTHTDRFQAISVGAGISDWMTYYVNTDIHPFTRQYLKATPWEDPDIYAKTSPISTITTASTPTLIQHGEFDRRVPIPNAYELLQGLRDVGIETRLIVYKGFGHGLDKPKERLAATWHNWIWFARHLWGEEVELPLEERTESETATDG